MKITFGQQTVAETEKKKAERHVQQNAESMAAGMAAFATFANGRGDIPSAQSAEKGKSLIEIQQDAGNTNVAVMQDYMTLAANTMSEEDYAKMQEEGFDFGSMNPDEAVTIVDKIKAELVRSGQHIAGYTDDLDEATLAEALGSATLAEALGSETLAKAVAESFQAADIPLTAENMTAVSQAWIMSSQLQPMEDGSYQYLIDNEMAGEIWNLYLAQSSGAGKGGSAPVFYAENVQGYYAQTAKGSSAELAAQIDKVIEQSGMAVSDETRQNAAWLLEKGLPLTGENLQHLEQLQSISLPVSETQFAEAVTTAVVAGELPIHASLENGEKNIYRKAAEVLEYYQGSEIWETTAEDIVARRRLEEIRLRMTAEVNVKLIKSGFAIDTAPMEQLVEALREAEQKLAEQYFPEDNEAVSKYQTYRRANEVAAQLPALPADVLGIYAEGQSLATLETVYDKGVVLKDTYEKARSSYETLMTAPRADLGDSIGKAFANVDDILADLGLEPIEANRRAVRILGYNQMEITHANLEAVSIADEQVQYVIKKMTPASVLKMIRDGVNPLEKTLGELKQYFEELPVEYKEEAESYSRFLYGLEKNQEITLEERESFIGIYRLLRQIEKADGAVVGALLHAQAEVHFSNLLSAVRSGKVKSIDARVSDDLGTVSGVVRRGESISEQIARAFTDAANAVVTEVSETEEAAKEYNRMQLEELRQAVIAADAECVAMLQRGELPVGADNLLAAQALVQGAENLFAVPGKKNAVRKEAGTVSDNTSEQDVMSESAVEASDATDLWETLADRESFVEKYTEITNNALEAIEAATFEQGENSLDVRRMQLNYKQLTVATALAKSEEYFVPMYIGEEIARVHLTFDRTGEEKGTVSIKVTLSEKESFKAKIYLENGVVNGFFTTETQNEVMKLEKIADTFRKEAENSWEVGSINVLLAGRGTAGDITTEERSRTQNAELYAIAKAFLKSVQQGEEINEN